MGYELHVRRIVSGDEIEDITEDEWMQFVADAADFGFRKRFRRRRHQESGSLSAGPLAAGPVTRR